MGSIKFPEPEPCPSPSPSAVGQPAPPDTIISPYTRSSTYSFPAPPTGEGRFDLRLSTQPPPRTLESARTFDTYGYPTQPNAYEGEGEVDPYSPSRTEVNTKLNSASYYSPSLISKQSRASTSLGTSKLTNSIGKGFDASDGIEVGGTGKKEKRNSGPSLGKSDNPNPSPNFPPPPDLSIDTTPSTLATPAGAASQDPRSSTSTSTSSMGRKIQRIKPPSLLRSTLPPKSPKSPSPLRYSSTFDMDDMPVWMRDSQG